MKDTTYAETFLEMFDDRIEDSPELTDEQKEQLSSAFPSQERLEDALPMLLEKVNDFNSRIDFSDNQIKDWQKTKKMWDARKAALLEILGKALEILHVPGRTLKADGVKLSTSTRSSLYVDEDWLVQQYQQLADQLQAGLPDFVKVKLTIDKTKLGKHLQQDNSLQVDHPDRVHTKTSSSTSIK